MVRQGSAKASSIGSIPISASSSNCFSSNEFAGVESKTDTKTDTSFTHSARIRRNRRSLACYSVGLRNRFHLSSWLREKYENTLPLNPSQQSWRKILLQGYGNSPKKSPLMKNAVAVVKFTKILQQIAISGRKSRLIHTLRWNTF